MFPIRLFIPSLAACALLAFLALSPAANTLVRVETPVGAMTLELYDDAKPVTVANFLRYIDEGRFVNSFAHRLPQGFVLQGGAFTITNNTVTAIPTFPGILNEAGPFPEYSNVKGTIVMAKVDNEPDSATSSWFINLRDNNTGTAASGNLDLQNSGFTVFGRVIQGLDIVDLFAAFTPYAGADGPNLIYNAGGALSSVPARKVVGGQVFLSDLIFTNWTIIPPATAPGVTTKARVTGHRGRAVLKGTATADTAKIEVKAGPKAFKRAQGRPAKWTFVAKGLAPGKYRFQVRATSATGATATRVVTVVIKD